MRGPRAFAAVFGGEQHKMFDMLEPNGILTTYSSKGAVRRALQAAGFKIEKLPGPAGKREMIRARK